MRATLSFALKTLPEKSLLQMSWVPRSPLIHQG